MKKEQTIEDFGVCWVCREPLTKEDGSTTYHRGCVAFVGDSISASTHDIIFKPLLLHLIEVMEENNWNTLASGGTKMWEYLEKLREGK